jgi:hypothetical protein
MQETKKLAEGLIIHYPLPPSLCNMSKNMARALSGHGISHGGFPFSGFSPRFTWQGFPPSAFNGSTTLRWEFKCRYSRIFKYFRAGAMAPPKP